MESKKKSQKGCYLQNQKDSESSKETSGCSLIARLSPSMSRLSVAENISYQIVAKLS